MKTSLRQAGTPAVLICIAALVVGCSASQPAPQIVESASSLPFTHIHALTVDAVSGDLVAATHEGIYDISIASDGSATFTGPRADLVFDPMGYVEFGDTAYASGHPGPSSPSSFGSPNLGLIASTDGGMTWTNISLTGQTDFHALAVGPPLSAGAAAHVYGIDTSRPAIQRSADGGVTWADGAEIVARALLADPTTPGTVYATTEAGLAVSDDDAVSFTVDPAAPALFLIVSDAETQELVGVDTGGTLWRNTEGNWVRGGTVTGVPESFTSSNGRAYVADDRGIAFTDDDGATWTVLVLAAH